MQLMHLCHRDYEYETSLGNDSINYNSISLIAPVNVGIMEDKKVPYLQGRVYGTYNHLFTDWIDNISSGMMIIIYPLVSL